MYRWSLIAAFVAFSGLPASLGAQSRADSVPATQPKARSADSVWLNTSSGVYHCRGTQYFGATRRGRYLAEAEAQKAGYRPAYGRTCGAPLATALKSSDFGSSVRVWVNTN